MSARSAADTKQLDRVPERPSPVEPWMDATLLPGKSKEVTIQAVVRVPLGIESSVAAELMKGICMVGGGAQLLDVRVSVSEPS